MKAAPDRFVKLPKKRMRAKAAYRSLVRRDRLKNCTEAICHEHKRIMVSFDVALLCGAAVGS
jgi:hypothetical protein